MFERTYFVVKRRGKQVERKGVFFMNVKKLTVKTTNEKALIL